MPVLVVGLLLAAAGAVPAALSAQQRPDDAERPPHASPLLPQGHWSLTAAGRLDELGLAPAGFDRGVRRLTRREVARAFLRAEAGRDTLPDALAAFAGRLLARYEAEFPVAVAAVQGAEPGVRVGGGRLRGGFRVDESDLLTVEGFLTGTDQKGPFPAPERTGPGASLDAALHLGRHLAVHGRGVLRDTDGFLPDAYATGTIGPIGLWAGRRSQGYGPGASGGIVLTDPPGMEGGGVRTAEPLTLPAFLEALGPVRFSSSLVNLSRNADFENPWLLTQRFSVEPDPRFRFAANRAMMFGGEGNAPITAGNVWTAFWGGFGGEGGEFENQMASIELLWRLPLATPVTAYLDYGFDDLAGGWSDTPAWVVGAQLPAWPGSPETSVGAEYVFFSESCCGNPLWYRHFAFTRGWSEEGRLLGHPLGGHGNEVTVYGSTLFPEVDAWLELRAFRRERNEENVFAPTWQGTSWGASLDVEGRFGERWEGFVDATGEVGAEDWSRGDLFAGVGLLF